MPVYIATRYILILMSSAYVQRLYIAYTTISTTISYFYLIQKNLHLLTSGRTKISILVTLCGKSLDLLWLCEQGHDVVGVELSEIAVKQLFEENGIPHSISGSYSKLYRSIDICIANCNMLQCSCQYLHTSLIPTP